MNAAVLAQSGVTLQDLAAGLEKALTEITITMFNCNSEVIPPDQVERFVPGISAVVGFGGKISGFIAIHLSPESACTMAERLLGMSFDRVDEIVADAMGETVNMLAGGLKKFTGHGEDIFKISVPSIVYGTDYSTHAPKNSECVNLGVRAGGCYFMIQLVIALH